MAGMVVMWLSMSLAGGAADLTVRFTLDFEHASLQGWTPEGSAFDYQPTRRSVVEGGQPSDDPSADHYWINTLLRSPRHPVSGSPEIQGDGPQGTLSSAPFTIPNGTLGFLIGGGSGFGTRVELLVRQPDARSPLVRALYATGNGTDELQRVEWDLTPWVGRIGIIRIVDTASVRGGHIIVDNFRFSDLGQVPALSGMTLDAAKTLIRNAGLLPGTVAWEEASQPAGTIVRQAPKAGTVCAGGTPVRLWLAANFSRIPDMRGMSLAEAGARLKAIGLRIEETIEEFSGRATGTVLRQSPQAGVEVAHGSGVQLWIASSQAWVPRLEGEFVDDARRTIEAAGLGVGQVSLVPANVRPGYVIRQDPPAGIAVPKGSLVAIDVAASGVNRPCHPVLEIDAGPARIGQAVTFVASLRPVGEYGAMYRFDFGDGDMSDWQAEALAQHVYSRPGTYTTRLSIRVGVNFAQGAPVTLEIRKVDVGLGLQATPQPAGIDERVSFKATVKQSVEAAEFRFLFGDGSERDWSTDPRATHRYKEPGIYGVVAEIRLGDTVLQGSRPLAVHVVGESPGIAWGIAVLSALGLIVLVWMLRRRRTQ